MQLQNREIKTRNATLNRLISELDDECQNVLTLVKQFQLSDLTPNQQAQILSELLAASIHLHSHCDDDFQDLLADELEALPEV